MNTDLMTAVASVLALYGVVMIFVIIIGLLLSRSEIAWEKRAGARLVLLSWAWPAVLVYVAWKGLKALWRDADWKGGL